MPMAMAALIGLARYRQLTPNLRYLTLSIICFLLPLDSVGVLLMTLDQNNLFLLPIYSIGELWLLALVYRQTLESPAFTRVMPWLVGGFTAYAVVDSWLAGVMEFRPWQQVLQSVLILWLPGLYFRKLLNELQVVSLLREPMFWVSTGLLIYFSGYLLIALFSDYLLYHYSWELNMNVWTINSLLFIILYFCYCRALWLTPQK